MEKTKDEVRELVGCALINLGNLVRDVPGLAHHPFFKIVRYQLECAMTDDESNLELK